jgi:chromosome segregation ATPase
VRADEDLIAVKTARISALDEQVAAMERSGQTLSEAYKDVLLELGGLKAEVKSLNDAVAELKQQLGEVTSERDQARAQVKKLRKQKLLLEAGYAALILLKIYGL